LYTVFNHIILGTITGPWRSFASLGLFVHVLLRAEEQVLNGLSVVLVLNADLAQEQEGVTEITDVLPLGGGRCGGS
jgi:hypothetical protein